MPSSRAAMLDIARKTAKLVELGQDIAGDDVVLIEDYAYPLYGVPSQETKDAIRLVAVMRSAMREALASYASEGMIQDTVEAEAEVFERAAPDC